MENMTINVDPKPAENQDADLENKPIEEETTNEPEQVPIDGKFELTVSKNFSEATVIVSPPYFDGKPVSDIDILNELSNQGVVFGIDKNQINRIVSEKLYDNPYRIAFWQPPEDGVDGTVTYLFEKTVENRPKENEKGFVDYRDLGIIRNIKSGTTIATITFPIDGTPGIDIKNNPVPQKKGMPAKTVHGENIGISGDGSLMLALADGNLKYAGNKFTIEKIFNMRGDVDASTGNLDFIGDIIVRGEVLEGFKITSQKNVTVFENITGAVIEAGGDVTIKKGCINSRIVSHGNVAVDFVESSNITCDGDLKGDAFITSTVYCGGELVASGKRGYLMGGKYTCLKNLVANCIGTKSYMSTIVTVGDNAIMLEEKAECDRKMKELDTQILRCTQAVDFLTEKKKQFGKLAPDKVEILNAAIKQKLLSQMEKGKVKARIDEIDKYLENKQNLSITCKKELYPGTKITINDFVLQVKDMYQYCKIYLGEDGIVTETL